MSVTPAGAVVAANFSFVGWFRSTSSSPMAVFSATEATELRERAQAARLSMGAYLRRRALEPWLDEVVLTDARSTHRNGLTVAWLKSGEDVDLREE